VTGGAKLHETHGFREDPFRGVRKDAVVVRCQAGTRNVDRRDKPRAKPVDGIRPVRGGRNGRRW
jgi:hypothetical protein